MERLTKRDRGGNAVVDCDVCEMGESRLANCSVLKCRNRLKDRLAAYEDAEEEGLLVRLPQKKVYSIGWGNGKNCDNLCPASIDGVGCCSLCDHGELIICEEECNQAHLPRIGKTVFLTREEAEKALEGMG